MHFIPVLQIQQKSAKKAESEDEEDSGFDDFMLDDSDASGGDSGSSPQVRTESLPDSFRNLPTQLFAILLSWAPKVG